MFNGATNVAGQVGQAFSFNGVNQSVQIPYSNELATLCFTVEAWVKPAQAIGGQAYIFGQAYGRSLVVQPGSGGLHVAFMVTDTNGVFYTVAPIGVIPIGQWTHLAGTWDGAHLKLYTNGGLARSSSLQLPAIGNSGCPFSIGGFNNSCGYYGQYFPGLIDEVSLYNRALFPGEINAIYLAGSAGKCKTPTGCASSPVSAIASWPGEGDASDMFNNYPGTMPNGVSFDCGIVGRAFSFNGTNQSVQIPDASALATAAFSVEVWVMPSGQVSGGLGQAFIFGQCYGRNLVVRAGNHGLGVAFQISSNSWSFHEVDSSGEIPIGEWTHLVGTWDGASLSLYINGALDQQAGVNIAVWDSGCPFSIGGFNNSCGYSGQYFRGLVDETTYYNEALSAADVQALYNAGSAGKCYSLGYWLQYYFGTNCWNEPYATAPADADGDGHTNFEEYLAHTDPNKIRFSISVTNEYVTTTAVPLPVSILGGVPSYIAVLTNDTNTAHANWQPYAGTNLSVTLGPMDGTYAIWVGLKGLPADGQQTWDGFDITLDRAGPVLAITNPILTGAAATVTKPYLQLAGWANEPLAAISYDLVNAAGTSTNLGGFVTDQFFDTNRFNYTTTYFQCFDIPLTNGANAIALHATDLAGNVSTTNITVTLDYSTATTPPLVSLAWPPIGIPLSGPVFYVSGRVSDETAAVTAQVVDAGGNTNVADGVVERNGVFWVEDLPLAAGASTVTLTVTDAAGNVTKTNLTVTASGVTLTIYSTPTDEGLYQAAGSVSVYVSDPSYSVVVNGLPATPAGSGYWHADNVPIRGQGTAVFDALASSGAASVAASAAVEMPAYLAIVDYRDEKSDNRYYAGPPSSSSTYTRGKRFTATYQADPSGIWTSAYHGVVADYSAGSPPVSWVAQDYDWSNAGSITHQTDSYGDDATWNGINENFGAVTGLPDQDLLELAPGGPAPKWVYHYYASGVHHKWIQQDGSTTELAVNARMRMKLFTGGKANINRQNLIHINASALEYGMAPTPGWIGTPVQDVYPATVQLLGHSLAGRQADGSGDLYLVLPDNAAPDLNLRIPRIKHYSATVNSVRKHKLRIAANGWPLATDRVVPNAKFCVGQKINLTSYMTPSIDDQVQKLDVEWSLPNLFVNYVESWPEGAKKYLIDWNLIFQQNTGAWWVTGGEKHPRCDWTMTFKNGQTAKVATNGRMNMHRPRIALFTNSPPYFSWITTNFFQPGIGKPYLILGTDPGLTCTGLMQFYVQLSSDFHGVFTYTSLISMDRYKDEIPPLVGWTSTTGGDFYLDGAEKYAGLAWEVPAHGLSDRFPFTDGPGFPVGVSVAESNDAFKTYARFQPDGADSIAVTIGRADWDWVAEAYNPLGYPYENIPSNWTIMNPNVPNAILYDDTDFPMWLHVTSSIGSE